MSLRTDHPLTYTSWVEMRRRVAHPEEKRHSAWVGKTVCARWDSFANFLADMGPRPTRLHTLDRIENAGNYEPANCRWATKAEQQRNRRYCATLEECRQMKEMYETTDLSQKAIAKLFGYTQATVWRARRTVV